MLYLKQNTDLFDHQYLNLFDDKVELIFENVYFLLYIFVQAISSYVQVYKHHLILLIYYSNRCLFQNHL